MHNYGQSEQNTAFISEVYICRPYLKPITKSIFIQGKNRQKSKSVSNHYRNCGIQRLIRIQYTNTYRYSQSKLQSK